MCILGNKIFLRIVDMISIVHVAGRSPLDTHHFLSLRDIHPAKWMGITFKVFGLAKKKKGVRYPHACITIIYSQSRVIIHGGKITPCTVKNATLHQIDISI